MLRRSFHTLLVVCTLFVVVTAQAGQRVQDMVVFGDSLSDPGNAFSLLGEQSLPPYLLIPDAPYAVGGHHFSNGPTWIEQLGHEFGVAVGPAFSPAQGFNNYAIGGARARSFGQIYLSMQVATYLGRNGGKASAENLYVIFIGSNDVRDAIESFAVDPKGELATVILTDALAAIGDNLSALVGAGAKRFLVLNAPDLGLVPAVRLQGVQVQQLASALSNQFNQGFAQILTTLKDNPSLDLKTVDIFTLLNQVVAEPANFKLSNVTESCITPGVIEKAVCAKPESYLFWDGIHPTRKTHDVIADAAEDSFGDKRKHAHEESRSQVARHDREERAQH